MAVVTAAVNHPQFIKLHNKRVTVKVFDHRSHHIDRLRQSIALFDWSDVTSATDITDMYNRFLAALSQLVHDNIPVNTVKLGVHDPAFVTPLIKELLRKRNKLRHKGKLSQANELAEKINSLIVLERSRTMTRLADAKPKQLWAVVKPTVSSKYSSSLITDNPLLVNVDIVNDFLPAFLMIVTVVAVIVFLQILFIMKVMCSFEIMSLNLICAKLNQHLLVWMICLVGYLPNVLMSWQV